MRSGAASRLLVALVAGSVASCVQQDPIPGELIGPFDFVAERMEPNFTDCAVLEVPDGGFGFSGTFSYRPGTEEAWFTFNGVAREASFLGGQVITSTRSAPRRFDSAGVGCEEMTIEETLTVALLSKSQDEALGLDCPAAPLDGGVPAPDEDAGIRLPGRPDGSVAFDAVRACGELVDVLRPPATCTTPACSMRYRVQGVRR